MHIKDNDTEDTRKGAPEELIDNELGKEENQREYKCKRFKAMELKKLGNFGRGDKVDDGGPVADWTTIEVSTDANSDEDFDKDEAQVYIITEHKEG